MKKVFGIICVLVILINGYVLLASRGEPAIRPQAGEVTDPILLPVIEQFADTVDANPSQPKPRMELGMTYESATLNKLAEETYKQYTEQFPKRIIGWYRMAMVQHRMGQSEKAIQSLTEGVKYAPPNVDSPHWQLAFWLIDAGRIEEAIKHTVAAASIKPRSLQVQIANGRIALAEGEPELAIEILNNDRLIANVPDGYVYQLLGRAYRAAGYEEKSREAWSRAGQSAPKWSDPWTALVAKHKVGLTALRQEIIQLVTSGSFSKAREKINTYFSHEPKNKVVRRLDALCDFQEGKQVKALQKWSIMVKEDPTDIFSMLLVAKARMQIEKFQSPEEIAKTKAVFDAILEIDPTNEEARQLLELLSE